MPQEKIQNCEVARTRQRLPGGRQRPPPETARRPPEAVRGSHGLPGAFQKPPGRRRRPPETAGGRQGQAETRRPPKLQKLKNGIWAHLRKRHLIKCNIALIEVCSQIAFGTTLAKKIETSVSVPQMKMCSKIPFGSTAK